MVTLVQVVWLIMYRQQLYDNIYYKWIAADAVVNIMAGWTYLSKL